MTEGATVLLAIDLQRSFCDADGSMARRGRPIDALRDAAVAVAEWSRSTRTYEYDAIEARCRDELARAEAAVKRQMDRNVFLEAGP